MNTILIYNNPNIMKKFIKRAIAVLILLSSAVYMVYQFNKDFSLPIAILIYVGLIVVTCLLNIFILWLFD